MGRGSKMEKDVNVYSRTNVRTAIFGKDEKKILEYTYESSYMHSGGQIMTQAKKK